VDFIYVWSADERATRRKKIIGQKVGGFFAGTEISYSARWQFTANKVDLSHEYPVVFIYFRINAVFINWALSCPNFSRSEAGP